MTDQAKFINVAQVQKRYAGVSKMTIERWQDAPELGMPGPAMYVHRIRFWSVAALDEWDAAMAARGRPDLPRPGTRRTLPPPPPPAPRPGTSPRA